MNASDAPSPRRVCFVTGTRAEFGLMRSSLAAIREHPALQLQIVATGMHLDPSRGQSLDAIATAGFMVDRIVEWPADGGSVARHTGGAMAGIAEAVSELQSDIVLIVGDRVEAFAAAAAGHLAGRIVAHVHGGDRALGQVDDALRHAIAKLSHLHFAATPGSANRVYRLGENKWRIYLFGAPGIDGILEQAAPADQVSAAFGVAAGRFALLAYHPTADDDELERQRAGAVLHAFSPATAVCPPGVSIDKLVVIYPNNDPGSAGIVRQYDEWAAALTHVHFARDVPRPLFLGLMRDAAVMAGNSSAGVIEAASFGTPVVDVGPRQKGRERSANVVHCGHRRAAIRRAVRAALTAGRFPGPNVYGGGGAGVKIANALAEVKIDERLRRKLIRY